MSAAALLAELEARQVRLEPRGGLLACTAPPGVLTDADRLAVAVEGCVPPQARSMRLSTSRFLEVERSRLTVVSSTPIASAIRVVDQRFARSMTTNDDLRRAGGGGGSESRSRRVRALLGRIKSSRERKGLKAPREYG